MPFVDLKRGWLDRDVKVGNVTMENGLCADWRTLKVLNLLGSGIFGAALLVAVDTCLVSDYVSSMEKPWQTVSMGSSV